MKSVGKARNNGLYRHIRTSKEIIRNLLNDYDKYSSLFYKYTGLPHFTPASVNNKSSSSATFIYGIQNLPVCPDGCIYNKSAAKQISSLPALQRFIFAYFSEKSFSDMLIYRTAYRCFRTLSPTFQAC